MLTLLLTARSPGKKLQAPTTSNSCKIGPMTVEVVVTTLSSVQVRNQVFEHFPQYGKCKKNCAAFFKFILSQILGRCDSM